MQRALITVCLFFVTFTTQAQRLHSTVSISEKQPILQHKSVELIAIPMLGNIAINELPSDLKDALIVFQEDAPYIADSIAYVELDKTTQAQEEKKINQNRPKLIKTEE